MGLMGGQKVVVWLGRHGGMWVGSARVQMGRNDALRIGRGSGCVLFDGDMSDLLGAYSDSAWRRQQPRLSRGRYLVLPSLTVRCCVPRVGPPALAGDPARGAGLRTKLPRRRLTRAPPRRRDGGSAARLRWRSAGSVRSRRPRSRPWNGAHPRRSPSCAARCGR